MFLGQRDLEIWSEEGLLGRADFLEVGDEIAVLHVLLLELLAVWTSGDACWRRKEVGGRINCC